MGQNFALNMASEGFRVVVGNRSISKVDVTVQRAKKEGNLPLIGASDQKDFISKLSKPRKVIILVMAGKPVDETIASLAEYMEPGDVIVDGGNEWYPNSIRRAAELESKGILFMGMGISGGEEGARNGPSLMPGGPRQAYDIMEPILTSCAAQVSDGACTGYIGPIGSGNYVKMVHNGIEYGDMQLIAEVYDVMNRIIGMNNVDMSRQFARWNDGKLSSYLIEITAKILQKEDDVTGKGYVVDYILDKTGMKGTGRWTVQEAAEQSVAAPTITASLDSRYISGRKDERLAASKILKGPEETPNVSKPQILEDLENALYCAKVCSYAQGISLIKAASDANGWNVDLSQCVKMWKGGCIIRAKLLDKIQNAFQNDPALQNLMVDPGFANELNQAQLSWRRIVTLCVASGIACPALSASLNYFDSYRRERLPANLTQAQRDFFGGHTYERIDKEGPFHCVWTKAHKAIGNLNERSAGEQSRL
jgi:6-phosphogluconate dehydrogenase